VALCCRCELFLPIVNSNAEITSFVFLVAIQRYADFVLILIFEIVDLKMDDPHLKLFRNKLEFHRQRE
jgi:hypothetical protein